MINNNNNNNNNIFIYILFIYTIFNIPYIYIYTLLNYYCYYYFNYIIIICFYFYYYYYTPYMYKSQYRPYIDTSHRHFHATKHPKTKSLGVSGRPPATLRGAFVRTCVRRGVFRNFRQGKSSPEKDW